MWTSREQLIALEPAAEADVRIKQPGIVKRLVQQVDELLDSLAFVPQQLPELALDGERSRPLGERATQGRQAGRVTSVIVTQQ